MAEVVLTPYRFQALPLAMRMMIIWGEMHCTFNQLSVKYNKTGEKSPKERDQSKTHSKHHINRQEEYRNLASHPVRN